MKNVHELMHLLFSDAIFIEYSHKIDLLFYLDLDKNTFWSHEEPNMALTSPHSGLLHEQMPDGLGRSPA